MTKETVMMRMFCKRAALAAVVILASSAALADVVTINVPVQLTSLAQGVTKGRVQCYLSSMHWRVPSSTSGTVGVSSVAGPGTGTSSEFSVVNGAYSGTVTVRVFVSGPPQAWIDSGLQISLESSAMEVDVREPQYLCYLQLATGSSAWHPEALALDAGSLQISAAFRTQPPAWSLPSSGLPITVRGAVTMPKTR